MEERYQIVEISPSARGKKELLKHLSGKKNSFKQAINAKCYDCMGYYIDGRVSCEMPKCPLFPFMNYNPQKEKRGTTMTEEQKSVVRERFKNAVKRAALPKTPERQKIKP